MHASFTHSAQAPPHACPRHLVAPHLRTNRAPFTPPTRVCPSPDPPYPHPRPSLGPATPLRHSCAHAMRPRPRHRFLLRRGSAPPAAGSGAPPDAACRRRIAPPLTGRALVAPAAGRRPRPQPPCRADGASAPSRSRVPTAQRRVGVWLVADTLQRHGHHPPPADVSPYLGLECSGTILALGPGVPSRWAVGDKVCAALSGGGYAEKVVVPDGVPLTDAAAIPEVAYTVWSTVFMTRHLSPAESFLIHGGSRNEEKLAAIDDISEIFYLNSDLGSYTKYSS
ncbi:hypothetical protein U9M48_003761 [Paspalum notatum var. saurae]|uniref:Alcohol dehydrogenase-like N-terminal domain-containing protein n=1 Tax=Paspalum notatum var. saurae TaxID=547442 RepID=A0AAQ3SKW2_PASNO